MRRAGRVLGLRGAVAAALVGVALAAGLVVRHKVIEANDATCARELVESLRSADTARVSVILPEIRRYWRWTEPHVRRIASQEADDSKEKLHASLALWHSTSLRSSTCTAGC